ncbi:MAG: hypothetical protein ACT4QE_03330, partial [Anaerolineales bacterium]
MLAVAALLTAFYTMRQITMVFFGKPRTEAAAHAHESHWTMTLPLGILSFFAVTAGWLNIPEDFPVLGPLAHSLGVDHWLGHILGHALVEEPERLAFTPVPLLTSIAVALIGLGVGWWLYRNAYSTAEDADPLQTMLGPIHNVLKNKYWVDEFYDWAFVRPTFWLAGAVSRFDRNFIDTLLHLTGYLSLNIGAAVKNYFDVPVVNGASDTSGEVVKGFGQQVRILQTGRVQQYLLMTMAVAIGVGVYLLLTR